MANFGNLLSLGTSPTSASSAQLKPTQTAVLGASKTATTSKPTGGSNQSASSQAQQVFNQATNTGGGNNGSLNISTPSAPTFDPTPFDNIIAGIDQLGNSLTLGEGNAETAINQNTASAITDLNANRDTAQGNLDTYKTQATNDANNNINEQRRIASEIQQGIQSRYGGTTGTGAFVSEMSGNNAANNIAKYRTDLQGEYSKVANMNNQLLTTYISEKTKLENNQSQQIAEAKQKLTEALSNLQVQKGQVGAAKSAQQTALLQHYQDTVNQINANNTEYQRQLSAQATQIKNQLAAKTYEMTYQQHQQLLNRIQQDIANGTLTPKGLASAEQILGMDTGSLQLPQKSDPWASATGTQPAQTTPTAQTSAQTTQPTNNNDLLNGVYNFFGL